MYDREKIEKTENNREKLSSGCFFPLTMDGGNCGPKWRYVKFWEWRN